MNKGKPFRVLSLDGGGMRGLYTAVLLDTLVKCLHDSKKIDIGAGFDLIVGTSTGGILATGLAQGVPMDKIISFYKDHGSLIFPNQANIRSRCISIISIISIYRSIIWFFRNIIFACIIGPLDPNRSQKMLKKALDIVFKKTTLEELWKKRNIALCIPAVHMATQKPWVFKTPHDSTLNRDRKYKLSDICLATSAAPTFFPLATIHDYEEDTYKLFADGGLWCNNPSIVGLIEALRMTKGKKQDIQIISASTAPPSMGRTINKKDANLSFIGKSGWQVGKKVVETTLESQVFSTEFQIKFIVEHMNSNIKDFKIDFIRLPYTNPSPEQASVIGLDKADEDAINTLTNMAQDDARNVIFGIATMQGQEQADLLKEIIGNMPSS